MYPPSPHPREPEKNCRVLNCGARGEACKELAYLMKMEEKEFRNDICAIKLKLLN